ncbi:MAG: hypothetical protein LQ340_003654 [Diploschistes diacapsis]|nr:MAG: hypothetical protein LQ340_003654 [Diploschistes diacapsis]
MQRFSILRSQQQCAKHLTKASRRSSSTSGYSPAPSKTPSEAEIRSAKSYCTNLLRKYDTPSYTLLAFLPTNVQPAYLFLRAFNLELARIPDTVSTPNVGALRLQFWRDSIHKTYSGHPPKQPQTLAPPHPLRPRTIPPQQPLPNP